MYPDVLFSHVTFVRVAYKETAPGMAGSHNHIDWMLID